MITEFMNYNFNINKIILACYVGVGEGAARHKKRSSHGLAFNLSGNKIYSFETGIKITVKRNSIIYLPKYSNYYVNTIIPGDCYAINFDIDENITFEPFVFETKNSQGFIDAFKQAEQIWKTKTHGFEMKCKSKLYNIIYYMQKEFELSYISKSKSEIINPALDYIHTNYPVENISIAKLALMCGISETYFRLIFMQTFGISPVKYIKNLKITRAKELIMSGMHSIHKTAELSGFFDDSFFCREFKKATGCTPSEYMLNKS